MSLRLNLKMMVRSKISVLLNVFCLSVAFAVLFIVVKQVKYDFSYDTCYPKGENIYRLDAYDKVGGYHGSGFSMPIIHQAITPVPEVESYTILWSELNKASFFQGEHEFPDETWFQVYPGFLEVFQPRIIAGDAKDAIKNNTGLVISESLARRWFGDENPIEQKIGFGNKGNLWVIKAVYEDFPENSSIPNGALFCLKDNNDWSEWSYFCYLRTVGGIDYKEIEQKIVQAMDSSFLALSNGESFSARWNLELIPIQDAYFRQSADEPLKPAGRGNRSITLCLLAVGFLTIVIAYINFINFSTAQTPSRIGAINICKVTGASMLKLKVGIVSESVFQSLLAWLLSVVWIYGFSLTGLANAYFNASLNPVDNLGLYLSMGLGAIILGIAAGIYPSRYMTVFQPAVVLKGSFSLSKSGRKLRNVLLVFQFVVAIILIIATFFVVIQHRYLRNRPWGYQKENVVYIPTTEHIEKSPLAFRGELLKNPGVLDMTASRYFPGQKFMGWGRNYRDKSIQFSAWPVAPNFLTFFGIPLVEGENLKEPPQGKDYIVCNQKMIDKFGLENVIGGEEISCFQNRGAVVGIAKNVNFASLHNEIEPMAFICGDDMWNEYIFVKIRPESVPETIEHIRSCFRKFGSENCEVTFLENSIDQLYKQEENLSRLIFLFAVIAIVISLTGIYGLIIFNIRYKVKEIGIRKINGATGAQVLFSMNRIFSRLVFVGFVIASPLAYMLVDGWLNGYPYRTPILWWIFPLAGILVLFITLLTVVYQSVKAANSNPVDAIKTE